MRIKCDYCRKEFERLPSKKLKHGFCSHKCYSKWLHGKFTGKNSPVWKGGKVLVKCNYCGKAIEKNPSLVKRVEHSFCSNKCHGRWLSEQRRGGKYEDSTWLREMYIDKGLSLRKVARLARCSNTTISWWMDKFGINRRKNSPKVGMSDNLAYILGAILSDGTSYTSGGGYCNRLDVTDKEFVDEFARKLDSIDLHPYRYTHIKHNRVFFCVSKNNQSIYNWVRKLSNHNLHILGTLEQKRAFLRGYYDGDGSLTGKSHVTIYTCDEKRARFLANLMKKIGLEPHVYSSTTRSDFSSSSDTEYVSIEYSVSLVNRSNVALFMETVGSSIPRKRW